MIATLISQIGDVKIPAWISIVAVSLTLWAASEYHKIKQVDQKTVANAQEVEYLYGKVGRMDDEQQGAIDLNTGEILAILEKLHEYEIASLKREHALEIRLVKMEAVQDPEDPGLAP